MQETRETPVTKGRVVGLRLLVNDDDGPLTSPTASSRTLVHRRLIGSTSTAWAGNPRHDVG